MSYIGTTDFMLEVAKGDISGHTSVNKFGRSTNIDSGHVSDVWDGANASDYPTGPLDDRPIWAMPSASVKHNIASTSADDDGDPVGDGARTIRVYGLVDWDTAETSEDITLDGTTDVLTTKLYVIIHRMKVLTAGTTATNVGTITATTDDGDTIITAQINPEEGQTQMAIYGIPSTQTAYMTGFYGSVLRANLSTNERHADMRLVFNPEPGDNEDTWLIKHSLACGTRAGSPFYHPYNPPNGFSGPGVLKCQAIGSAENLDVSMGFDLILVND